jgi:hypothetical protein
MNQPVKIQSQFCITAALDNPLVPSDGPTPDRRTVERQNRVRQQGIVTTRQKIAQMEATIADFTKSVNELEGWIEAEQIRTGNHDPAHYAYSVTATAMIQRRDALRRSRDLLQRSVEDVRLRLADAMAAAN